MSYDLCRHGEAPWQCKECKSEREEAMRGPWGPKGVEIREEHPYAVTDRRASQQPDKPEPSNASKIAFASMVALASEGLSSYSPMIDRRSLPTDSDTLKYRSARKHKNKAARKARRANR